MTRDDLLAELTAERFGPIPRTPKDIEDFERQHPRRRVAMRRRRQLMQAIANHDDESEDT